MPLSDALLFLDETGTANYFKPAQLAAQRALIAAGQKPTISTVFGLAGVLFRRADYMQFRPALAALKQRHFGYDGFTLHEYDLRKMQRQPFVLFKDQARWQAFYDDLDQVIAATDFRVIVATIDKIAMQEEYLAPLKPYHPYQYSLHVIIERVINEKAFGRTCRIIAEDRQAGMNDELSRELLRLQLVGGTIDGKPTVDALEVRTRIDPIIRFRQKVHLDAGLEMADLAVGPVTRWLHSLGRNPTREIFPVMRPKLRRSWSGVLRGYGVKCLPDYPPNCPA
jgi:hypothetical protein